MRLPLRSISPFWLGATVSWSSQHGRVWLSLRSLAFYLGASSLQVSPHASSPTRGHSNVGRRYEDSWGVRTVAVRFRLTPLVEATLKLSRSGTGRALFARQSRVPWHQHAANSIGRQSAANVFAHPQAFADGALVIAFSASHAGSFRGRTCGGHATCGNASTPSCDDQANTSVAAEILAKKQSVSRDTVGLPIPSACRFSACAMNANEHRR